MSSIYHCKPSTILSKNLKPGEVCPYCGTTCNTIISKIGNIATVVSFCKNSKLMEIFMRTFRLK